MAIHHDADSTPVDVTVCCVTNQVTVTPLTADEISAQQSDATEVSAQQAAENQARQDDIATVAASTDPVIQALARLLGIV